MTLSVLTVGFLRSACFFSVTYQHSFKRLLTRYLLWHSSTSPILYASLDGMATLFYASFSRVFSLLFFDDLSTVFSGFPMFVSNGFNDMEQLARIHLSLSSDGNLAIQTDGPGL